MGDLIRIPIRSILNWKGNQPRLCDLVMDGDTPYLEFKCGNTNERIELGTFLVILRETAVHVAHVDHVDYINHEGAGAGQADHIDSG